MGQMFQSVVCAPYSRKFPCLIALQAPIRTRPLPSRHAGRGVGARLASLPDPCPKWRLSLLGGMVEPREEVRMRRLIVVVAGLALALAVSARAADTAAGKAVFDGAKPACNS